MVSEDLRIRRDTAQRQMQGDFMQGHEASQDSQERDGHRRASAMPEARKNSIAQHLSDPNVHRDVLSDELSTSGGCVPVCGCESDAGMHAHQVSTFQFRATRRKKEA